MYIVLIIERNLLTQSLLIQPHIPCVCKVGRIFELSLTEPLPNAHGEVFGYDLDAIVERAPASVGGTHLYHHLGTVSLTETAVGRFEISALSFFNRADGWIEIVKGGQYAPPRDDIWGKEPEWVPKSTRLDRAERRAEGRRKRLEREPGGGG